MFFKEVTLFLKQPANKPPLTLSNNYSHYFQCDWHFSRPFPPPRRSPSKWQKMLRRSPNTDTNNFFLQQALGLIKINKQLRTGPWRTQVSRRKHHTWKNQASFHEVGEKEAANSRIAWKVKRETVTMTKEKAKLLMPSGEAGRNSKVHLCSSRKCIAEQNGGKCLYRIAIVDCFLSL